MVKDESGSAGSLLWDALTLSRIERKPKRIIQDDEFVVGTKLRPQQERDYATIVGLIRIGGDLERFYRRSKTSDILLRTRQILHLHLGGPGSDAILYVIQYPEHVLLVRIDSHIHLDDLPPGKKLPTRGRLAFQASLKAEAKAKADRLAAAKARLLRPRKPEP